MNQLTTNPIQSAVRPLWIHDVRKVNKLFSLGYSEEQLRTFGPPPPAIPEFITYWDWGWDILKLRARCKGMGIFSSQKQVYDQEEFMQQQEEPCYRQIRMEAVEGSFERILERQQIFLPHTEEIPLARRVALIMATHFRITEERLFPACYVRCMDRTLSGFCVSIGFFGNEGFSMRTFHAEYSDEMLGLASEKKKI